MLYCESMTKHNLISDNRLGYYSHHSKSIAIASSKWENTWEHYEYYRILLKFKVIIFDLGKVPQDIMDILKYDFK